jgi:hypothetical protein
MSSGGQIDIIMHADEKDLIKGQAKVIKQQDEMIGKYKKMLREATSAAKGSKREMEKFAAATTKINRTPAERYRQELDKLNRSLKQGLITQETYNRAVGKLKSGHKAAFGGAALSQVMTFGAGVLSVGTAISGMTAALRGAREETDRLAQSQREATPDLAELAQMAETPADMQRMVAEAKKTFTEGGASSLGAAGALQFRLESAGVADLRKAFSDLQSSGLVRDTAVLADSAAALDAALGGAETGGFRALISKGFGASKGAPATVEQILQGAALGGAQAKAIGISDEQLLAAMSTVAKVSGPERAATQVQSFLKQVEKFGIGEGYLQKGQTLREYVQSIQQQVSGGEDIRDILGDRQEGITAFRLLSEGISRFDENLRNIETAQATDAFGKKVEIARTAVPSVMATHVRQQATARAEIAASQTATWSSLADALSEDVIGQLRQGGASEARVWAAQASDYLDRAVLGDRFFIRQYEHMATPETRADIQATRQAMADTAAEMRSAAVELRESAQQVNHSDAARANQAAVGGAVEAH